MEPIQIIAHRTPRGIRSEAFSAEDLFQRGYRAQAKANCAVARRHYEKLLTFFSHSVWAAPAHYNLALCFQRLQRFGDAAIHFEAASRQLSKPPEQKAALGAAGVNYAEAKRWQDSRRCFGDLLKRSDLSSGQRIEAQARLGLAWFHLQRFSNAMKAMEATLTLYRLARKRERLPTLFYVAMAAYYKAHLYHEQFLRSPIRLPASRMLRDMEQKATWMYKAQKGYWRVVNLGDHFWAMAAVYQVGSCYWELRRALLAAPVPAFYDVRYFDRTLKRYEMVRSAEQREEYFRKLRERTRILLKHAMKVYRKGLTTAERIGAKNLWVRKMQRAYVQVKAAYSADDSLGAPPSSRSTPRSTPRSPLLPRELDPNRYEPSAVEL